MALLGVLQGCWLVLSCCNILAQEQCHILRIMILTILFICTFAPNTQTALTLMPDPFVLSHTANPSGLLGSG